MTSKKERRELYRAAINLPGARYGQVVTIDPDDELMQPFIRGEYLVPVGKNEPVEAVATLEL